MKKITLAAAAAITSPNPLTLVCTKRPDGGTNLAAVSWWTYVSYNPEMIAYAMSKQSYSGELVRGDKNVVLSIPGEGLADAVMKCGTVSGRDEDKAAANNIALEELPGCGIKIPQNSRAAIQCRMKEYHETGDHFLYICDVEQVFAAPAGMTLFAWNGYAKIAPASMPQ